MYVHAEWQFVFILKLDMKPRYVQKKTQEGFTHDWEVFVRGCDGAEIHYYIEKVVFYLHETFPKPKRVIKEPPYVVKESGYAGFNLPIDIYLRNNGEPKKIRFNYDLHLQQSGPPIIKVQKEKYVFNNISDEFRTKLLKGGGMIVNASNVSENVDNRSNFDDKQQMINKPKLAINSSDIIKKPKLKISDSYNNDNFQELFGSPILTTSKTIDTKQPSWKDTKSLSKSDKEKWRTKHSPHKDSHKDRDKDRDKSKDKIESERKSNRDDKKNKEKLKDRERSSKDKERNLKKERTPSPKRNNSPKRSPARLTSPLIIKHKDSGSSSSNNNNSNNNKHDKDKRGDKSNDDRKLKKEKRNKEHKENKQIDDSNRLDEQRDKIKLEKDLKKDSKDSIKVVKTENPASPQLQKPPKKEKSKDKKDKDPSKEKYKSKKKDKERKDDKEKKSYSKNDKKTEIKQKIETQPLPPQQQQTPLPLTPNKTTIKKEKSNFLVDEDSSSSSSSSTSSLVTTTTTTTITTTTATPAEKKSRHENSKNKDEKTFKTNKKDRTYQDNQNKYNKRKSNSPEREEPPEKQQRDSNINNNLDDKEIDRNFKSTINQEEEDYLNLLRELQHKIMGLKDNNDLTKVVQLIAETGRYEVSAHTFDFDLCLLDRSTVQQLQNFFTNEY